MNMNWILFEVLTIANIDAPSVLEIAAQKYDNLTETSQRFRVLINNQIEISPISQRFHGYSQALIDQEGIDPNEAFKSFNDFCQGKSLVSSNLKHSLDSSLLPVLNETHQGSGIALRRGFSLLELASRILDPLPVRTARLSSLCSYYKLEQTENESASGNLARGTKLFNHVLCPLLQKAGIIHFDAVKELCEKEWYSSKISFGKFKGKDYREANDDIKLKDHLIYTSNGRTSFAKEAAWYLANLENDIGPIVIFDHEESETSSEDSLESSHEQVPSPSHQISIWRDPEVARLKNLIGHARDRLATIEADLQIAKSRVDQVQGKIFKSLKELYEKREILNLRINYRSKYLDFLLKRDEDFDEEAFDQLEKEEKRKSDEFDEQADKLSEKKELTLEEEQRIKKGYRKLAIMFHPDKNPEDPERARIFDIISQAKENNDLEQIERILQDPETFALCTEENLENGVGSSAVKYANVLDMLNDKILLCIEDFESLKKTPEFEMAGMVEKNPEFLDEIIESQKKEFDIKILEMEETARDLELEIEEIKNPNE